LCSKYQHANKKLFSCNVTGRRMGKRWTDNWKLTTAWWSDASACCLL